MTEAQWAAPTELGQNIPQSGNAAFYAAMQMTGINLQTPSNLSAPYSIKIWHIFIASRAFS